MKNIRQIGRNEIEEITAQTACRSKPEGGREQGGNFRDIPCSV